MKNFLIPALLVLLPVAEAAAQTTARPAARGNLRSPSSLRETAPGTYKVKFDTSKGEFVVEVTRAWAPNGADRFYNLVKNGFFDNARFFRVIPGFMVQFGLTGDPAVNQAWTNARIPPDPVTQDNARGTISFAMAGTPDSRTTQVFINYGANGALNRQGFAPFGKILSGMEVVDAINSEYREGPQQPRIRAEGNAYLNANFPRLDFIRTATIEN
jgi:peptidyl-prolyl cis-trans isomerase A (cyclophilin A)